MDDLISRKAAIDEAKEWIDAVYFEENDKRERKAIECFIGSLKNMPSAQPERKTGKWYKPTGMMPPEYAGVYRCSECDEIAMRDWKTHKQKLTNFCPNCGAQMRGDKT